MLRFFRTVALALSLVPFTSVDATPPGCDRSTWSWPGYVMGGDRWGVVLSPFKSSAEGNAPASVCSTSIVSSSSSSSSSFSSMAVTTSLSNVYVADTTTTSSMTASTSTSSIFSSFIPQTSSFESTSSSIPSTTSTSTTSSSSNPPPDTTSSSTPVTTSSTQDPSSSSSSSEAPAPTTQSASLNASPSNSGSDEGGSNGSTASNADVSEYLSAHNSVRAQHGASPFAWNNTLAAAAQKWSDGCLFQHSDGSLGPFGENLAAGTGSDYSITSAVTSWTNEASQYNPNNPSASHFTQVVWKGSTQLGCAATSCAGGTIFSASSKYYDCEYFPQGNIIGAFAANVQA